MVAEQRSSVQVSGFRELPTMVIQPFTCGYPAQVRG